MTLLGKVLYWLGCIIACVIIWADVNAWSSSPDDPGRSAAFLDFALLALAVWVAGRACQYVLTKIEARIR
jgi:hypothetical protein